MVQKLSKQLQELDDDIKEAKLNLSGNRNDAIATLELSKRVLQDNFINALSKKEKEAQKEVSGRLLPLITSIITADPTILLTPIEAYDVIENTARTALNSAYSQVDEIINNTLNNILSMGDALYDTESHPQIVAAHKQMITELSAITISVGGGLLPDVSNIAVFAKIVSADSDPETEDYFVGNPARSRDMKAPMVIFEQYLPNVREIFHFDVTDFQNVHPFTHRRGYLNKPINPKDFLDYGGEIPLVWKFLLRDYAFVETNIDFQKILSYGYERKMFYNQGTMPCRVGKSAAIDMNNEGKFVSAGSNSDLHKCAGITLKGTGELHHVALNTDLEMGTQDSPTIGKYSELGIFLDVTSDGMLKFRDNIYDAYYYLWKSENDDLTKREQKKYLPSIEYAPFTRNQIGDYLFYKENEQKLAEQKTEAEASYRNKLEELVKIMTNYGYELPEGKKPEDIDLSEESVFASIRSSLDNIKNELIGTARELQSGIYISEDYDTVKERVETLSNVLNRLEQDSDEWVNIGDDVGTKEDLDARIKSAKANEDAANKYEKETTNFYRTSLINRRNRSNSICSYNIE